VTEHYDGEVLLVSAYVLLAILMVIGAIRAWKWWR
jgi:hypothetical protein